MGIRISQEPASADRCRWRLSLCKSKDGSIRRSGCICAAWRSIRRDAAGLPLPGDGVQDAKTLRSGGRLLSSEPSNCVPLFPKRGTIWVTRSPNRRTTPARPHASSGLSPCSRNSRGPTSISLRRLGRLGRFDDAIAASRQATELSPRSAEFYNGLGMALVRRPPRRRSDRRLRSGRRLAADVRAGSLQPQPRTGWHRAITSMAGPNTNGAGNLIPSRRPHFRSHDGTEQFSRRRPSCSKPNKDSATPFSSYVTFRLVKERVGSVILRCQKPLVRLLSGVPGIDRLISQEETARSLRPLVAADEFAPDLHTERRVDSQSSSVPGGGSHRDSFLAGASGARSGRSASESTGKATQHFPKDRFRSIPLRYFEPLAQDRRRSSGQPAKRNRPRTTRQRSSVSPSST